VTPRYFVPRAGDPEPVPPLRGPLLTHVRDVFRVGGRGRSVREVAVVTDRQNVLHWVDDLAALPGALRAQVHHHELLLRRPPRHLDVTAAWLFELQLVEQAGDAPGLDDPVWLYGRLSGPYPTPAELGGPVTMQGQLTVSRSDLLAGFVRGSLDALHVASTPPSRALHALLPGDREDELERGRGVILAYPMVPAELAPTDAANEALVAQILHDVLSATAADAKKHGHPHPLAKMKHLPVPSRADVERELDAKGWDVKGDVAYRRTDATRAGSLGGFLSSVFGVPDHLRLDLPPEGTLADFVRLAELSLPHFPGHPDRRARAVAARTGDAAPAHEAPREVRVPRPSSEAPAPAPSPARAAPPAAPSRPRAAPAKPAGADWMKDFVTQHAAEAKPRLTPVRPRATGRAAPAAPDWMKDFED
jgi:hypothetical protein